jgi:hypothetical protein
MELKKKLEEKISEKSRSIISLWLKTEYYF